MEELAKILFPYFYYKETGLITSIWVGLLHVAFFALLIHLIIKTRIIKRSILGVSKEFAESRISSNKYLKDSWILYFQHFVTLGDNTKKLTILQKAISIKP